jgi:2-polyprenyl-3-methyl-5-hydroxy-6-metoxy-1,4-benzoquinol methylase
MERLKLGYKEYWGYQWRIVQRHKIPDIFKWDEQLVDLIEKVCALKPGAEVLDLGCAGGDQLKLFARKGYKVTGIDYVPALIEYAKETFKKEGLTGELITDDMRNIVYHERFDLVTMLSGTFGYFNDAGNREMLVKINRALKPGGTVFIDYPACEQYFTSARTRAWNSIDNGYALTESWFDVPTSTLRSNVMHILLDGRIIEAVDEYGNDNSETLRCYTAREMVNLAEETGFTVKAHLTRNHIGNPDYQPKENEPRRMIVLQKGVMNDG